MKPEMIPADPHTERHPTANYVHPDFDKPDFVPTAHLVTMIRVVTKYGHDHLSLWNRGAKSGELIVREGDGIEIARCIFHGQEIAESRQ